MIKHLLLMGLRAYHAASPMLLALLPSPPQGRCCRFEPSCSCYAYDAVEQFGPIRGLWMGVKRVARCHPWHSGGFDPVIKS